MTTRGASAIVTLGLVATLVACSGDDDVASTTTLSVATTVAPVSTSAEPTPSSTQPAPTTQPTTPPTTQPAPTTEPAPTTSDVPVTTIEPVTPFDWFAIVDTLLQLEVDLPTAPSIDRVGDLCLPESACFDRWETNVNFLTAEGLHIEGLVRGQLMTVEFGGTVDDVPIDDASLVNLRVVLRSPALYTAHLVDADGNVVSEVGADEGIPPNTEYTMQFVVGRTDPLSPWRLVDSIIEST